MKQNELKVYYARGLNKELDDALTECLNKFGYILWASGMAIKEKVRNLAFEKDVEIQGS